MPSRTQLSSPTSPDPGGSQKLKDVTVALRSIALSTPADQLIGRESELLVRLGCHQSLLRQASRRLEAQGLIYIRRGVAGGYFAARPDEDLVIDAAALHLIGRGLTLRDTLLATRGMVRDAAGIAADRAEGALGQLVEDLYVELGGRIPEDTDAVTFLQEEERIDRVIFEVVGIGALQLFINMLNRFALQDFGSAMFTRQPGRRGAYRAERLLTLKAIASRDADAARRSMDRVHDLINSWLPDELLDRQIGFAMVMPGDGAACE